MSEELTLKQLTENYNQLKETVEKQTKIIATTGKQLLEFQVKTMKEKISATDKTPSKEVDDLVTNDDLVQLVGELQSQLDFLEERTIRRSINLISKDHDKLIPMLNIDGDEIDEFPETLIQFKELSDSRILKMCKFYELLPIEEVDGTSINLNEMELKISDFKKNDFDKFYNQLARFVGVNDKR